MKDQIDYQQENHKTQTTNQNNQFLIYVFSFCLLYSFYVLDIF